MKIQYVGSIPEKAHVLHVGLLCDDGVIREVPVRKDHYESLAATRKLAYVKECAEYHHPSGRDGEAKRNGRRAIWNADDQAVADAAAAQVRAAEEARLAALRAEQKAAAASAAQAMAAEEARLAALRAEQQVAIDAARAELESKKAAARAEAVALAAKQAQEAYERFTVRALAIEGGTVQVAITHHNVTIQGALPADPATLEQNARAAFSAWEQAEAAKAAELAAFAIG